MKNNIENVKDGIVHTYSSKEALKKRISDIQEELDLKNNNTHEPELSDLETRRVFWEICLFNTDFFDKRTRKNLLLAVQNMVEFIPFDHSSGGEKIVTGEKKTISVPKNAALIHQKIIKKLESLESNEADSDEMFETFLNIKKILDNLNTKDMGYLPSLFFNTRTALTSDFYSMLSIVFDKNFLSLALSSSAPSWATDTIFSNNDSNNVQEEQCELYSEIEKSDEEQNEQKEFSKGDWRITGFYGIDNAPEGYSLRGNNEESEEKEDRGNSPSSVSPR
jgi:hypothetical protein